MAGRPIARKNALLRHRHATWLAVGTAIARLLVTNVNLLVAALSASDHPEIAGITPQQINAQLFARLSQFVIWCHAHRDLVAVHPDLAQLLQATTGAPEGDGIPEPSPSVPRPSQMINPIPNSETVGSDAAPR